MPIQQVPIVRVAGTHREVGVQLGRALGDLLRRQATITTEQLPPGRSVRDQLELADRYRTITARVLPWIVEEIDAAAEASGAEPRGLFASSVEEIWTRRRTADEVAGERSTVGRCTDIVVTEPATADGHTWIAHTNDEAASSASDVTAIEWMVAGEPVVLSIGAGPWISVGWNDAGIAVSGNELTPNDERVGVPRVLMVREQLSKRTIAAASAAALRPDRASSYNTVLADRFGSVVDIEGSAGDAELIALDRLGTVAHTNHYTCPRMLRYEGDPAYARRSARRLERARELLAEVAATPGSVTPELLRSILADHANAPDSICRHAAGEGPDRIGSAPGSASGPWSGEGDAPEPEAVATVFWAISDITMGRIVFGPGNPCAPAAGQSYAFATWGRE